jgi:hypothetical protein
MTITVEVEITETQYKKEKIKIELPIYRKSSFGDFAVTYTRISEDLSATHVHVSEEGYELRIIDTYNFDHSGLDYHLGRGEYALEEERFYKVARALAEEVSKVLASDTKGEA